MIASRGRPVHEDLVRRGFTAPAPNQLWLTDITEHLTGEGKLYLCAINDACSKRIVGYSIDARRTAELAVAALRNAVALRGPAVAVVHSDRGSQFDHMPTIETTYHRRRRQDTLGRLTPVEFETLTKAAHAA